MSLALDAVALARAWPLLFIVSLPALWLESPAPRRAVLGGLWSVVTVVHVVLMQYFRTTQVPLGADLFGYSLEEVAQTFGGGVHVGMAAVLHLALPLAALWAVLRALERRPWQPGARAASASLLAGLVALIAAPAQARLADAAGAPAIVLDKSAYFVEDTAAWLARRRVPVATPTPGPVPTPAPATGAATAPAGANPAATGAAAPARDPRYPFLHAERTPDVLGPLLHRSPAPPNLVFVIVEGLGRSFSGPGAAHGSFTPYLDELAGRSLYFENFLANQGRTFAALPTIFGSLPFGDEGFAAVKPLPAHVTLLSILAAQGYHVRFYAGFDLAFDQERPFLEHQGVESLVDLHDFGSGYVSGPSSWGYGDGELAKRALAGEGGDPAQPSVVVVQTVTMHTSYRFPGQADYAARLERRLDELGIAEEQRKPYREQSDIYTSILYADDALRTLVEGLSRAPGWSNTVLIVTGDHCLPELPMATRIERYHVPLIIHSPLLDAPARIKAVSSQMDLAPSLLAYLANNYGLRTPAQVTWLGTGLDVDPGYRNVHDIPLKLAKHLLADFVQGPWYFSRGQLFKLGDGMSETPVDDAGAASGVRQALERFAAANDQFTATATLMPASAQPAWEPYQEAARARFAPRKSTGATPVEPTGIAVSAVRAPGEAQVGALRIGADFSNAGKVARTFVPLVVLLDASGHEVSETYGPVQTLAPRGTASVEVAVKSAGAAAGQYFVAVVPSDAGTGKPLGVGRYHVPVRLQ